MAEMLERWTKVWEGRGLPLGAGQFLVLLLVSVAAALVVALLYVRFYGRRATGSEIHRAFPLLAVAVTAIFVCIQFSLPLSLGLLGALSIVRFRTPIKEPEEIGFLMVVIATSLAAATGLLPYLGVVVLVAAAALVAQELTRPVFRRRGESGLVIVTFDAPGYDAGRAALLAALAESSRRGALESLTRQDDTVTLVWRFAGLARADAPALESRLARETAPRTLSIVYDAGAAAA
jgi:hypothetical protein